MKTLRLLVTLVLTVLFASTTIARADSGAQKTVDAFYNAYIRSGLNWTDLSRMRKYLTPSLYSLVDDVVSKQKHEEILDFDPFVNAQEEAQSVETVILGFRGGGGNIFA